MEGDVAVTQRGARRARAAAAWVLPVAVVVAAVGASAPGALTHAMYFDEIASARVVSEPSFGDVLERVRRTESTPPAWYVVAWSLSKADASLAAGKLFSDVERLRFLSVLFAAAASLLTAMWALRLLDNRLLAALAGFLVALGSVPAAYGEQLRAYALVMLLSVSFGLLLVRVADRPTAWPWCALALCVWLGVMTHYFFFFVVAGGGLWLWAARPRLPGRTKAAVALGLGLLGFLPWLPSLVEQMQHGRYRWIGVFNAVDVATLPGSLFFGPDGLLYGLARIAVTLALVVGVAVLWRTPGGTAIVGLGLLPVIGAGVVWALGEPIFDERNMLPVVPFMAILVAAAPAVLPKRLVPAVAVTGIVATLAGAAFAYATLDRVAYDRVADALVDVGWTADEPVVVDWRGIGRGTGISLATPVSWYLPESPNLIRAPARQDCATTYALVRVSMLGPWLARHRRQLADIRDVASYDHLVRGRENGRIIIARFSAPVSLPGVLFYARGHAITCLEAGTSG